jgi:hypothetical protein
LHDKAVRSGASAIEKVGMDKFRRLVHALGVARRNQTRGALLAAESISIKQDVRSAQLVVAFTSADSSLNKTDRVLGQCDLAATGLGFSARGVAMGTMYIVHKAAKTEDGVVDKAVVAAVREKTEVYAADAAGDEQLAGGPFVAAKYDAPSPNLIQSSSVLNSPTGVLKHGARCCCLTCLVAQASSCLAPGAAALSLSSRMSNFDSVTKPTARRG